MIFILCYISYRVLDNGYNLLLGGRNSQRSDETKLKLSKAKLGNKNPRFGKDPWNKGKKASDAARLKMSTSRKGKKPHNTKRVLCHQLNIIFTSCIEASIVTGIHKSWIAQVARGKRQKAKGYTFIYVD